MYTDINNPVLMVAIDQRSELATKLIQKRQDIQRDDDRDNSKVCRVYLYNDWDSEDANLLKLFCVNKNTCYQKKEARNNDDPLIDDK